MHYVRPGSLEYIVWKINSIRAISLFDTGMRGITSAEVRWLSFLNIVSHLWDTGNILWGVGLGGYFTDDYIPFASFLLDGSAFKNEWILQNKLYKPHGAQLVILLKMGVIGAIVYLGLLLIFFIRSWKATVKITSSPLWHSVCAACVAFLPLLSYKNFTSKIQIFMGITMAVIVNIVAIHTRNFRNRRITL
jgi:O-antigen ligase